MDIFLWGYVKDYVYRSPVDDIASLHAGTIGRIQCVETIVDSHVGRTGQIRATGVPMLRWTKAQVNFLS
jgi:hypothetical protein